MFENGKLFIGGIAWDTNEERLKEYFSSFGDVIEAVIMKDRTTGRARGFGFIVFADPAVAERVIKEKHNIDGRMVEAKKAVPRDDQNIMSRSASSNHGSPGPGSTRKIFVGGLASTVTENDFKKYFDQFGNITDVVVMQDHNTQRPRGFGFITYDSEETVDKVLLKNFHELNGKLVEVKRAVPKELSPSPNHSPLCGYNYDVNRINNFLNGYTQGYGPNNVEGYGLRMGARFSPVTSGRSEFPPFGSGDGMGIDIEPRLNPAFGSGANFSSNMSYGRGLSPYNVDDTNRFGSPIGYDGSSGGNTSFFSSVTQNLWGNSGLNYNTKVSRPGAYMGSGSGSTGGSYFGNSGINWGSAISSQFEGNNVSSNSVKFGYGSDDKCCGLGTTGHGRNSQTSLAPTSNGGYDGAFADLYGGVSVYGDVTRQSSTSEPNVSGSFGYGLGGATSDVLGKSSPGYVGGYSVNKRQTNIGKYCYLHPEISL
ncbi:Heteroproteinous nuclear ribonucleoprotein 1 [Hibiscus syriacus]|uniref:Heteroproteinous nuclear ribonucleoprotein 1 n=1 Tax=Hibiscus syriacus TaxID=106335 RepID=A0A6A3BE82_HIBSY|nr:heterogeneous nuclear ribonucleoprotein 1-like [Hibiscus syriacus]XP_038990979.1 heterogeneous nuclear ribonucleoprotein 1-like [Hibiscus syriacus]XP_038990980.1 heterogeneous nuclear ribonucleoprotein 1-like [Hibiscus syriacus]KAE8713089.1 Heteroproteinous nuclear ribonucleoprotein 1 [Hibiscus syriacus]